jgi:hypothetical protein
MERFDFDAWAELARRDPAAFEQARRQALYRAVEQAPSAEQRARLGQLVDTLCAQGPCGQEARDGQAQALTRAVEAHNRMRASLCELTHAWAKLRECAGERDVPLPRAVDEFCELRIAPLPASAARAP